MNPAGSTRWNTLAGTAILMQELLSQGCFIESDLWDSATGKWQAIVIYNSDKNQIGSGLITEMDTVIAKDMSVNRAINGLKKYSSCLIDAINNE